jgi:hypothetical protein
MRHAIPAVREAAAQRNHFEGVNSMAKSDNQITGIAGEFLTAGKLSKLGLQVSITFGNTKAIDLFAYNPATAKQFAVQVKTSRGKTNFRELNAKEINPNHIFVFVCLNALQEPEDFYIVKGSEILKNVNKFFGSVYTNENPPEKGTVNWKSLTENHKDNWDVFCS